MARLPSIVRQKRQSEMFRIVFLFLSHLHIKTNILQDRLGTNIGKTPKRVVIKRSSHLMKGVDCVLRKTQKTISVVFLSFSLNYLC
eukprot:COSAG06_NODE_4517_length_4188_cov_1.672536_3_plen_86_part_00